MPVMHTHIPYTLTYLHASLSLRRAFVPPAVRDTTRAASRVSSIPSSRCDYASIVVHLRTPGLHSALRGWALLARAGLHTRMVMINTPLQLSLSEHMVWTQTTSIYLNAIKEPRQPRIAKPARPWLRFALRLCPPRYDDASTFAVTP